MKNIPNPGKRLKGRHFEREIIVLIGLIDLHLERGSRMPRIKVSNVKCAAAQPMHAPWRHRTSLEPTKICGRNFQNTLKTMDIVAVTRSPNVFLSK